MTSADTNRRAELLAMRTELVARLDNANAAVKVLGETITLLTRMLDDAYGDDELAADLRGLIDSFPDDPSQRGWGHAPWGRL